MSTRALTWLAGAQCLLLGALILVAPHQFAGRLYSPLQPHLVAWGGVFVVSGASLLATAALALAGRVRALAHLIAGGALLALGVDVALGTAWVSSINYSLLGVATVLVPLLGRPEPRRGDVPRSALGLTVGAAVISTGIYLVITPQGEPNDARLWNGVAFEGGGLMLMAWTAWPKLRGVSVL